MKVLVTGVNGFLGSYWLEALLKDGVQIVATTSSPLRPGLPTDSAITHHLLDITDSEKVQKIIREERPDAILHAAALSKPDDCERDPTRADRINTTATQHLLKAAAEVGSYFCYLSTDFVFDGITGMYREEDLPDPVNHYGFTKWQAEKAVQNYPHNWSVVRTVLVYGKPVEGRPNLLTILADRLRKGQTYSVVDDQFRTPTFAGDLAAGVCTLIRGRHRGFFHICGAEMMTPYDMAVRTAQHLGLDPSGIVRVSEQTFQQPARRPKKTGLNIQKAQTQIGFQPRSFVEGLALSFPK